MKRTARQTVTATLADLTRAADRQRAVTITYLKEEKDTTGRKTGRLVETVRTIEIYETRTTKAGHITLIAMDRETQDRRTFRLDRIAAYTVHRTGYTVPRPPDTLPAVEAPAATVAAVVRRELARDRDDTDYQPAA